MNVEQNRLETFNEWPPDASVSPQRIAKAGFYSTKQGLEVECFSCGIKISEWNYGDQVMARHKNLSPRCPFVLNPATSGNVPSIVAPPNVPIVATLDYKNESIRLASFENWPVRDIVSPELLAKSGFYSLRSGDKTKCAFCNGVVRAWEQNDIPDVEHKRHFPSCPFVISIIGPRLEEGGNRAGGETTQESRNLNLINNSVDGSLDELGVHKHIGPKRADYGTVEARLRSFVSWSPHLIQTPNILAQAGFYYEGPGMGDQVRCFHCDGGLRHWDPDDDPWTEHARWFPRCSFVNLVKGTDFVTACSLDNVIQGNVQSEKTQPVKKRREVTEEELRTHMTSDVAVNALGIGIDVQRVKRAIKEKLELTGRGYSQADALVEAALNMQLEEDDGYEQNTRTSNQMRERLSELYSEFMKPFSDVPVSTNSDENQPNIPQESVDKDRQACRPDLAASKKLSQPISLEEENRLLKEARQCKICMDAELGVVFVPCGHLATCVNCAPNLEDCPVCRSAIRGSVRTFLS